MSWSPSETELLWAVAAINSDAVHMELMDHDKIQNALSRPFFMMLQEEG